MVVLQEQSQGVEPAKAKRGLVRSHVAREDDHVRGRGGDGVLHRGSDRVQALRVEVRAEKHGELVVAVEHLEVANVRLAQDAEPVELALDDVLYLRFEELSGAGGASRDAFGEGEISAVGGSEDVGDS